MQSRCAVPLSPAPAGPCPGARLLPGEQLPPEETRRPSPGPPLSYSPAPLCPPRPSSGSCPFREPPNVRTSNPAAIAGGAGGDCPLAVLVQQGRVCGPTPQTAPACDPPRRTSEPPVKQPSLEMDGWVQISVGAELLGPTSGNPRANHEHSTPWVPSALPGGEQCCL